MKDINCPYCNAEQDINHDDGYGYEEGSTHQQECGSCGKTFVYTTSISFYYEVYKADCLNGSEHDYEPTHTHPKRFTMMRCTICDDERKPTKEEFELIGED
jgi:hypothetical protein